MSNYENMSMEQVTKMASQGDHEAQYEVAYRCMSSGDYQNAINCFKKIVDDPNHPRNINAINFLAEIYAANGSPYTNKKEAIRLYESIMNMPRSIIGRLNLGLLYCEEGRIHEGLPLFEGSINKIIEMDGNDNYLSQILCYKIAVAYEGAQHFTKSTNYYNKAIDRSDTSYESDRQLVSKAREGIADNERRKAMLGDSG